MRHTTLILVPALCAVAVLGAQATPAAPAELAAHWARAMPYAAFLATDSTAARLWADASMRATARVDELMRDAPFPAGRWRLLVVAENSCSDALAALPYFARLAERMPAGELRILRPADATALMQTHLLDGHRVTPIVLVLDTVYRERGAWMERAAPLQAFLAANEGTMSEDALWTAVRAMRRADDGRTPLQELLALLRDAGQHAGAPAAPAP